MKKDRTIARRSVSLNNLDYSPLENRNLLTADAAISIDFANDAGLIRTLATPVSMQDRFDVLQDVVHNAGSEDSFRRTSLVRDELGFAHIKHQQYRDGIPIEGAIFTVHIKDRNVVSVSGPFLNIDQVDSENSLTQAEALQSALDFVDADLYAWEVQGQEHLFGSNQEPTGELIYLPTEEGTLELTWMFDVFAVAPLSNQHIFVDASSAEVLESHDQIHTVDVPATGTSLYNGTVDFTADDTGTEFRLSQETDGIWTLDSRSGDFEEITSTSPSFNADEVQIGVQAHYGGEQAHRYFLEEHGRDSFDGNGDQFAIWLSNSDSSFWLARLGVAIFGGGDGTNIGPVVSLDIVGHEFAHGVNQYSGQLNFQNESGALNDSFSDIFGEGVENFATGTNDWLIGHEIGIGGSGALRSLANPNLLGDPDTYQGDFWHTGASDNGGVHTNSGVQNKWFHILTEGESGTNDNGDTYDVTGIGIQEAADIAFRNLTVYLTPNSNYEDARQGSIQAAIDLFGAGSQQVISTAAAWDAVGVYGLRFNFAATSASGSGIFRSEYSGELPVGIIEEVQIDLDENQTFSAQIVGFGSLTPTLELRDPSGNLVGSDTGSIASLQNIPIDSGGTWTVSISGANGTGGYYEAFAMLNAGIEAELRGSDNNTQQLAQDLDANAVTFGVDLVDRLAVGGVLESRPVVYETSFESGTVDGNWLLNSSNESGRIEVTYGVDAPHGNFSLLMDSRVNGNFARNEAILTVDLDPAVSSILTYSHVRYRDEIHQLPDTFTGSYDGDGVAVSEDGETWHTISDRPSGDNGVWIDEEIDLKAFATTVGISLGPDFKIKFQQYDDHEARILDGRAWDAINISPAEASEDWYSFTVAAGQQASVAVAPVLPAANARVSLYDAGGNLLRTGDASTNYHNVITDFSDSAGGTFYARVEGDRNIKYDLLVSRGAAFDAHDSSGTPIAIDQHLGAVGFVDGLYTRVDPDDATNDGDVISTFFPGVVLSTNDDGGDIVAVAATFAPTGSRVFGGTSGFLESVIEFRADFQSPQLEVSIDVGSDDGTDTAWLRAYDAQDNLLEQVTSSAVPEGEFETLTITRTAADIAYVVAAGVGEFAPLDNLVYSNGIVDEDLYSVDLSAGDVYSLSATLPGTGPYLFDNGLDQATSKLVVELVDPDGNTVASHFEQIDHTATETGTYTIRVTSTGAAGEYQLLQGIAKVSVEVSLGDNTNSRSIVDDLTLTFDEVISIEEGDLILTQRESGQQVDLALTIDNSAGFSVVDVSFSGELTENTGSLVDGNYELTIRGSVIDSSLDFVFGDREADDFFRFFGDADGNRLVNAFDLLGFRNTFRLDSGDADFDDRFDVNGDDLINAFDLLRFRQNFGDTLEWV